VFEKGLDAVLNGEKMNIARDMLMGKQEAKEGIPCSTCKVYRGIKQDQAWVTEKDIESSYHYGRKYVMFENKILGKKATAGLVAFIELYRKVYWQVRNGFKHGQLDTQLLWKTISSKKVRAAVLKNQGHPLAIPLAPDEEKKWKPYFLFRGLTRGIEDFSCHVSTLVYQHCPHPPHTHKEEEILMMLSGEADLLLPLYKGAGQQARLRLKPGEFVYYPPDYPHTLQTTSEAPANYLMFKWYTPNPQPNPKALYFGHYKIDDSLAHHEDKQGFSAHTLFEGPSKYLTRLHCHTSILSPGAGYKPHVDSYDVAIIVLEGEVETLNGRFTPHSVIFHPAGKRHGILNPGTVPARYVVFEFQR
jgi:quercetin dioxygenase-like cupin family protein